MHNPSMPDALTISSIIPRKSMHFRSLREKAIENLQLTSAKKWSDHNVHDPGITILEDLCYVITEISNQLNFSFEDLIATAKGIADANINYPSAATNLPCRPVTITDFRKIILDLPEIRNAYFDITHESKIPVYYTPPTGPLTYDPGATTLPIVWSGLYAIQLEMEDNELNSNTVALTVTVGIINVDLIISFKYWDELSEEWFKSITITGITLEDTLVQLDTAQFEDFYSEWTLDFSDGSQIVDFSVWIKLASDFDPTNPALHTAITTALAAIGPSNPFVKYKTRMMAVQAVIDKAKNVFLQNRNLGEDLSLFIAVRLQEIAIDASIEIQPTADPVEQSAQILFAIESFFLPHPVFHSLEELIATDYFKVEDVFLGPLLNSGFLSEYELKKLSVASVIYVSDILRIIVTLNGIAAVRDLSLTAYFNNLAAAENERNCVRIPKGYKPRLSIPRTTLKLTRNGVIITVDPGAVITRLDQLRIAAASGPVVGATDLQIPFGSLPPQGRYRSVQYELPSVYGTGSAGIPLASSPERIGQLKQLQGYLFLYDQVLANTFSQLANIGDFFAVHQQQSKTYYQDLLYHVPGVPDLIGHLSGGMSWEDFIQQERNAYTDLLNLAGESDEIFFQRRNQVLDYLLSRTAESRQAFAAILSSAPGNFQDIILHDKENFLERYPMISQARAHAYNYKLLKTGGLPDVWDTDNVGGYNKIVSLKSGFISHRERTLVRPLSENFDFFGPVGARRYKIKDNGGNDIMVSQGTFLNDVDATNDLKVFINDGRYIENYEIVELSTANFSFGLKIPGSPVDMIYNGATVIVNHQAAVNAIKTIIEILGEKYTLEGMHVVEHILLRPRIRGIGEPDSDKLFANLIVEQSKLVDPYSHVVTVVIPSGLERDFANVADTPKATVGGDRWRDPEYLLFVQQTILREAPSHLLVNIFPLDIDLDPGGMAIDDRPSLQNFERKWKAWREAVADPAATVLVKRTTQRQLVTVIEKIYGP